MSVIMIDQEKAEGQQPSASAPTENGPQTEEALRQQQAFLRQVIDINPHFIFARDREGRFTLANEAFAKLYHTTVEEILGKTDADFNLNPQLIEQSHRDDLTVMTSLEEIFIPERQITTDTAEKLWWQIIKRPIIDEQGQANQILGVVTDITDLKTAQEAVITSEERLRHVIASISGHIYVTELSQTRPALNTYISPNVEALMGYPAEKFTNNWHFWHSLIHPEDRVTAAEQVAHFSHGRDSEVEYRLIQADGGVIWVRDSGRVEKNSEEQPTWVVYGVVTDITAHKQIEATLRLARDQALEANRLKTQLLAKVSHELRTPLTTILGFAEMLEFGVYGKLAKEQQEAIADIINSADYLKGLVNELLDQAQLEAGKLKLDIQPFAPAELIEDVQAKMNVLAQHKGLCLKTEISPELPTILFGDSARIQQILVNLVSNAIKFTKQGYVGVRVYRSAPMQWALEVSDTGPGIPAEAQGYIFEPFQQVDGSITREHGGSGLGLSIVKQLTTLMAGQVALKSRVGQGSTFTVFLPLEPTQEDD